MYFPRISSNQSGYKCYSPVTKRFYNPTGVTFFEEQPFYPKSDIQEENPIEEYQIRSMVPNVSMFPSVSSQIAPNLAPNMSSPIESNPNLFQASPVHDPHFSPIPNV